MRKLVIEKAAVKHNLSIIKDRAEIGRAHV